MRGYNSMFLALILYIIVFRIKIYFHLKGSVLLSFLLYFFLQINTSIHFLT